MSSSSNKLITVETEIFKSVYKKVENSNEVFIPYDITHGIKLHIAIDNTDFHNKISDRKSKFYRATFAVFQKTVRKTDQSNLHTKRSSKTKMKFEKYVLLIKNIVTSQYQSKKTFQHSQ